MIVLDGDDNNADLFMVNSSGDTSKIRLLNASNYWNFIPPSGYTTWFLGPKGFRGERYIAGNLFVTGQAYLDTLFSVITDSLNSRAQVTADLDTAYFRTTNTWGPVFVYENTYNTGGAHPIFEFYQNRSSAADADNIFRRYFFGNDDAGNKHQYGQEDVLVQKVADGQEAGQWLLSLSIGGAAKRFIRAAGYQAANGEGILTFNHDSVDIDIRINGKDSTIVNFDAGQHAVSLGNADYIKKWLRIGDHLAFITVYQDTFYTSAKNDSTQY
jgi:hypothetical protein